MINLLFSKELIEDAALWKPRYVREMSTLAWGQMMEFERSLGVFSEELWKYDKEGDRLLRERLEQHVKEICNG